VLLFGSAPVSRAGVLIEVLGCSAELLPLHRAPAAKSTKASTAPTMTSSATIIASRRAAVFAVLVIVLSFHVCDLARLLRGTFAICRARSARKSSEELGCAQRGVLAATPRAASHCLLQLCTTRRERERRNNIPVRVKQRGYAFDGQFAQIRVQGHGAGVMPSAKQVAARVP